MDDSVGPKLNHLAILLAKDVDCPLDRTLLYGDVEPGAVSVAVFKDMGEHILYRAYRSHDLEYELLNIWEGTPEDKRWVDIEYFIHDGKFDAVFVYPDQMGGRRGSGRRDEVLRRYYGDKPVVYPPWPDDGADMFELPAENDR